MSEKPIEFRTHEVHFFLIVQGDIMYRRLQVVVNDSKDRELARKSVTSYQRAFTMMADDGVCYTSESYFNDFFGEFVTNSTKIAIADFDKTYPKWKASEWDGFIPVGNDSNADYYHVGNNNQPIFYKRGVDY